MGQYYKLVVLNTSKKTTKNADKVKAFMTSWDFNQGAKLMEFSWIDNDFVCYFESLINKENGLFAGYPILVAGDYADEEPNTYKNEKVNIYQLCAECGDIILPKWLMHKNVECKHYRYLINEDKKVFIDTNRMRSCGTTEWEGKKYVWKVNPLPILCNDGCIGGEARGGGDYSHKHREVGAWRRNVVVTSDNRPDEKKYREVFYNFREKI